MRTPSTTERRATIAALRRINRRLLPSTEGVLRARRDLDLNIIFGGQYLNTVVRADRHWEKDLTDCCTDAKNRCAVHGIARFGELTAKSFDELCKMGFQNETLAFICDLGLALDLPIAGAPDAPRSGPPRPQPAVAIAAE